MRVKVVEIRWHGTKPIFSADFQPSPPSNLSSLLQKKAANPYALSEEEKAREAKALEHGKVWRLATAGGDNMVMTWLVHPNPELTNPSSLPPHDPSAPPGAALTSTPAPTVEYLATLQKHLGVVNVVRFCPKGEVLASAGDDGNVLLWVLSSGQGTTVFGETAEDRQYEREAWRTRLMLRGPAQCEIYDIAWSPSGEFLFTGDTAKTARIWNATDGQCIKQITEHSHNVQGVAWDPLGQYIATQSSDRSMHIYSITIQKDASGAAVADCHHVGKHHKMDVVPNPGGSWSSSPTGSTYSALPPVPIRPTPKRSLSAMSDISTRSEASSIQQPPRPPSSSTSASLAPPTPSTSSMQPPSEIPHHHHHTHSHVHAASVAPVRSHSRQSSSSTHASPALSATTPASAHVHGARIARSPSPAPPLPAVAIEAEHHFRPSSSSSNHHSAGVGSSFDGAGGSGSGSEGFKGRERGTIKLYGDEEASMFFRRLEFSTDGALLVSPAGRWEDPWMIGGATANGASASGKGKTKGKGKEADETTSAAATGPGGSGGKKKRKIQPTHHGSGSGGAGAATGDGPTEKPTVYIYGRASMGAGKSPLAHLPGHRTSSVAIRFSPVVYRLNEGVADRGGKVPPKMVALEKGGTVRAALGEPGGEVTNGNARMVVEVDGDEQGEGTGDEDEGPATASVFALPYRMVYAVATHDTVFVYDTQQAGPVCMFGNLHYASFTDVAWSADGRTLVLSSSDGYCSLVAFGQGELGTPIDLPPPPASALTVAPAAASNKVASAPVAPPPGQTTLKSFVQMSPRQTATGTGTAASASPQPPAPAEVGEGQEGEADPKKKKRRVALTFEGPTQQ